MGNGTCSRRAFMSCHVPYSTFESLWFFCGLTQLLKLTVEEMLLYTVKMTNPRAAPEAGGDAAASRIVSNILQDLGLTPGKSST